jgi:hypothetical protein
MRPARSCEGSQPLGVTSSVISLGWAVRRSMPPDGRLQTVGNRVSG